MNQIKGVQEQWQDFVNACDPRGRFPHTQKREMRRAFLGGVYSMMTTCIQIAEIDSEDAGAAVLESLRQECERMIRDMVRNDTERASN